MLASLSWRGFRNLADGSWEPPAGTVLLLGANGAGKTSLLEAIYVLATGRSFRAARLADCCRHGGERCQVAGRTGGEGRVELEVGWDGEGTRRRVNGSVVSLARHLAVLPIVSWTSADSELVGGGPGERRRLLDQGVVGMRPAAIESLARYRRALEQKRRLLQRGGRALEPWNELLATAASELALRRRDFVEELARRLAEVLRDTRLDLPPVSLDYLPSLPEALEGAAAAAKALDRLAGREVEAGAPLAGPHRDELRIGWGEREARRMASAGERKLVGLALAAARGRVLEASGREPLFLLDDLDAELDQGRLEGLWRLFGGAGQRFVTSAREAPWEGLEVASRWRLEGGRPVSAAGLKNGT